MPVRDSISKTPNIVDRDMDKVLLPKALYYTTGLPGAGKTTFANNLAKETNIKVVSLDTIALDLFKIPSFKEDKQLRLVLNEAGYRVEDYLWGGDPVIYDGNVNTVDWRKQLKQLADKLKVMLIPIYIDTPINVCKDRAYSLRADNQRQLIRTVTEDQFNKKLKEFIEPETEKNLIIISGTENFEKQFSKNIKALAEIMK